MYSLQISPSVQARTRQLAYQMHCHACRTTRRLLTPAKLYFKLRQNRSPAAAVVAATISPLTGQDGSWELARRDQLMFVLWRMATKGDLNTDEEGLLLLPRQLVEQECDRLFPGVPACMQSCFLLCGLSPLTVLCKLLLVIWVPVRSAFVSIWAATRYPVTFSMALCSSKAAPLTMQASAWQPITMVEAQVSPLSCRRLAQSSLARACECPTLAGTGRSLLPARPTWRSTSGAGLGLAAAGSHGRISCGWRCANCLPAHAA